MTPRCAYCGGFDKEDDRDRCLSCGAPMDGWALDAVHMTRTPIDVTSFADDSSKYLWGMKTVTVTETRTRRIK